MAISLIVIILFAGVRYNVGNDFPSYYDAIMFGTGEENRFELIPKYLIKTCKYFNSALLFFFATSVMIYSLIWRGIYKQSKSCLLSVLCFLGMPLLFFEGLCIVRQEMALSIIFYAYCTFLSVNKRKEFIACIILASLCHVSAMIGLIFLIPIQRISKYLHLILLIISSTLGTVFANFEDIGLLRNIVPEYYFRYFIGQGDGSGQKMMYLYLMLSILNIHQLFRVDVYKESEKYRILSFVNLGFSLYLFFSYNPIFASRMSLYFVILLIIAISYYRFPFCKDITTRRLFSWAFICLFFIELFLCYRAYVTEGDGNNIPYDTFFTNEKAFQGTI